jgi:hypothetical protein
VQQAFAAAVFRHTTKKEDGQWHTAVVPSWIFLFGQFEVMVLVENVDG